MVDNQISMIIDRVNERDEPVGTISRGEALQPGVCFRVVHLFLINANGEILLEHLGKNASRSPGRWGSSVAGYLHAGESYAQAAQRRLREERGLMTELVKLGSRSMPDEGATKFITVFTGAVDLDPTEPDNSGSYVRWIRPEEIDQLLHQDPAQFTETFPYAYGLFRFLQARH